LPMMRQTSGLNVVWILCFWDEGVCILDL